MSGGFGIFKSSGGGGGGGSGLTSVPIENTLYVAKNGSDSTGVRNDLSKPFLTIAGASAAASPSDAVYVYSGAYIETSQESFVTNVLYYLELGAIVSNTSHPIVSDTSGAKKIRISGEGSLLVGTTNGVILKDTDSELYLELYQLEINANGDGIDLLDLDVAYINIKYIINNGGKFFEVGGLIRATLEFITYTSDNTALSSFETRLTRVGGDEGTFNVNGVTADIDFSATGGQGIKVQNGAGTAFFSIDNINNLNTDDIDFIEINSGDSSSTLPTVTFTNSRILSNANGGGIVMLDGSVSMINVFFDMSIRAIKQRNGILNLFNCYIYADVGACLELLGGSTIITNVLLRSQDLTSVIGIIEIETGDLTLCSVQSQSLSPSNVFLYSASSVNVKLQGTSVSNKANSASVTNIIAGTTFITDANTLVPLAF